MIVPTVGRVLWYRPDGASGATLAAIVCGVNSPHSVNLFVLSMWGEPLGSKLGVRLLQDDDIDVKMPQGPYAEWMPYQKGQAAKTETLEAQFQRRG